MDVPDAEQVIEALPCLASTQRNCVGCGYNPHPGMKWPYGCIKGQSDIVEDAIALLKAQEPRLMTLEEILSSDGAVWILDHDDKGCEIHIAFPLRKRGELDPVIEFRSKEPDMLEHRLIRDYLIGWCCWTSRPTAEQREATPWQTQS